VGLVLGAASTAMLALIRADGNVWVDVLPATVLSALGFGLTLTPLTIAATSGVPTRDAGLASGLFNSAQEVGAALGIAIFVSIATSVAGGDHGPATDPAAVVDGYQVAFLIGAALIAAAALAVALLLPARIFPAGPRRRSASTDRLAAHPPARAACRVTALPHRRAIRGVR
jgi:hypothetical protein